MLHWLSAILGYESRFVQKKKEVLGLTSSVIEVHFAKDTERECIVLVQYIN